MLKVIDGKILDILILFLTNFTVESQKDG